MNILTVGADGNVSTTKTHELEIYKNIIAHNIDIPSLPGFDVKVGLIYRTVFRLKKYTRQDLRGFRQVLAAEVRSYLRRPVRQFYVVLPLHVMPGQIGGSRSFVVLHTRLLFRTWRYIRSKFDWQQCVESFKLLSHVSRIPFERKFTPVVVVATGRDPREAFDTANRVFELFRTLLNLLDHFGRSTRRWGGYPEPLARILPPPAYAVFKANGEYEDIFYNLTRYSEYKDNRVVTEQIRDARRLASRIKVPSSDDLTMAILLEALEKYGQALDTAEWRLAFLTVWQILEAITLQSSDASSNIDVVKRVNMLMPNHQAIRDLLQTLYETRNRLVHRGQFPDEEGLNEVNLLKYIADRAIDALFGNLDSLPTRSSLARYYEHATLGDADLANRRKVIGYIQRRRMKGR